MNTVAFCGVPTICCPPRGTLLGFHVTFPRRRRTGSLFFYNHRPSAVKIMAKKPNPKISFVDLEPYENDDVTIHVEDDFSKDNPKTKKDSSSNSSSPRLSRPLMTNGTNVVIPEEKLLADNAHDELEASGVATNTSDFVMKLRKPGLVYDSDQRSTPKVKSVPSLFIKLRSEDMKNMPLLKKPEVGKPYPTGSRPDYLTGRAPSDGSMISQSYKAQKSEYELYLSRPIQVSLDQKPEVMTMRSETAIPVPSIDKSLEGGGDHPKIEYHLVPDKKQKTPPLMSKFTEQADIDLRKPSIPADSIKTNPKPEPKLNPSLDMQRDSSLSLQADTKSELQLKPLLDKARYNREDLRNLVINKRRERFSIADLRKPDVSSADNAKTDRRPENEPRLLSDENRCDYRDSSNVGLQERGEMATTDSSELDLKPKLQTNISTITRYSREDLSMVLLHKKPEFDVGLQKTNQGTDGDKLTRNESSDAGSISSEEEEGKKVEQILNHERAIVKVDELLMNESSDAGSISSEEEEWKKVEELLNRERAVVKVDELLRSESSDAGSISSEEEEWKKLEELLNREGDAVKVEELRNEPSDAGSVPSEEVDWKKVDELLNNGERVVVKLTGYNHEGYFATLGSIVGFIPYRNLSMRYIFLSLDSWLRKKGADPTLYRQKVHNIDTGSKDSLPDLGLGSKFLEQNQQIGEPLPDSNSALVSEDLFLEYQREKDTFLSSFIGQKLKVRIVMADKGSQKVLFTGKRKEHQELLDKKRNLMDKLKVGDIVKCCIYRFAYFGIFVEVEGVPALIPQGQIPFDGTLDLLSSLKLGQTLDARIHRLDYTLERITLSLKRVTPDPLKDDFESVVGGDMSFGGTLKAVHPEEEWEDVESLIKELEKLAEVNTISKGTFFLSSGIAPTFQVYLAPMVDDRYRFLARFGNKAQEILVQASMDEEEMKNAISACTSRLA